MHFNGTKVLVMGLGSFGGGVDAAVFAHNAGADVTVTDIADAEQLSESVKKLENFPEIKFHLGGHLEQDFKNTDIIIANPAVPPENEFLQIAKLHKKIITSQVNIFFQLCPAKIVGITGANGKSTTTSLTTHILKAALPDNTVWLAGNIGNKPMLSVLDKIKPHDIVVLELSSFQTEQLSHIAKAPHISLLTNLTPNHLDRHGTFQAYCDAKEQIFKNQALNETRPAISIFNAEDEIACEWYEKYKDGIGRVCVKFHPADVSEDIRNVFKLPGQANLSNLSAAIAIAKQFNITDKKIKDCISNFKSLPHRLEFVAEINSVKWYNDSISTTPESSVVAIESFDQPKIIIAGGYDKKLSFDELAKKIATKAKAAILIGQTAGKIANAIKTSPENKTTIAKCDTLQQAVEKAHQLSQPGDVVILSPACASYDMFKNFQQRGEQFKDLVKKIQLQQRSVAHDSQE